MQQALSGKLHGSNCHGCRHLLQECVSLSIIEAEGAGKLQDFGC